MSLFARQLPMPQRVPDLTRFVDTPRQKKDPCFNCTLPFCNDRSKECAFIQTSFGPRTVLDRERKELITELKEEGVIVEIKGNGFIQFADDTETPQERQRRSKRDYMRRVRGNKCTTE